MSSWHVRCLNHITDHSSVATEDTFSAFLQLMGRMGSDMVEVVADGISKTLQGGKLYERAIGIDARWLWDPTLADGYHLSEGLLDELRRSSERQLFEAGTSASDSP